ncbi:GDP-mannose 4,6-dehydratase [Sediminibacterium sp.]|uniref:GDP-mannose 4,6-dehydratase n=1 Tax=Sediminibacterium sp. TaxID=1917865 RepID=UPI0027325333|nr:GDP-mannose 4,6-dehydratase [Sediminibacterium sp.]MDP3392405.1 GDP-mannose 4,6-dehydratase [Sediminibacterium sp.]MDP3565671.1 GDP-mannose 4,6-dehydratase [Sediminibacterium sp.]
MKAIIFGANGQDGYYLGLLLKESGIEVHETSRTAGRYIGDVADYSFVSSLIKTIQPSYIFSFAANSTTNHSALFENHQTISTGTWNILESVRLYCNDCKVFLSGSAMQFQNTGKPINESTSFEASSPYSVARIQSTYAARYYKDKFSMHVYVGYFFNHDSPLRSDRHINQKIVSAVKRIVRGSSEKIEIGDLSVRKEFAFAKDIVEGVWVLVNQEQVHEAVIGVGVDHSIQDWIEICFKTFGLNWRDHVVQNVSFKPEYKRLVSDPSLIRSLGWNSETDIFKLADLMIRYSTI